MRKNRFAPSQKRSLSRPMRVLPLLLTVAVLLVSGRAQTAPTTITFGRQTFATGPNPMGLVSGDFNEDGKVDLAVLDSQANTVQVVRNDGAAHFSLAGQIHTGMEPVQIVTGIFNRNGHQDLAIANSGDKTMTILLGKGDGTFTSRSFALGGVPTTMIAANFLNNGLTQLAVGECASADARPCSLKIYQCDSQASFFRAQSSPLPAPAGLMASDDFNLDHKPDLAVASGKQLLIFSDASRFDGTGTAKVELRDTISPPMTSVIDGLVTGHFNVGTSPDLAIEVFDDVNDSNFPNSDYVYLNDGFGSFFVKQRLSGEGFGHVLAVSDINGDGLQDLLQLGSSLKNQGLSYALGRRDGTFSALQTAGFFSFGIGSAMTTRDLNRDSRHDIALTSIAGPAGPAFTGVMINQNGLANCPAPSSATVNVKFCSVTPSADHITVTASANSPNGVKRVELWVDGSKRAQAFSDQLRADVAVSAGSHRVTVVGVDLYDGLGKNPIMVTVP